MPATQKLTLPANQWVRLPGTGTFSVEPTGYPVRVAWTEGGEPNAIGHLLKDREVVTVRSSEEFYVKCGAANSELIYTKE